MSNDDPDKERRIQAFIDYAIRHDQRLRRWNRLAVPMGYLIAGLVAWGAFRLFDWPGIVGVICVGMAYQIWWRWRHGRWMINADWMEDDS